MIYLPHPEFKFEGSEGGGCLGYLNPENNLTQWIKEYSCLQHYSVDVEKLISKFKKHKTSYWETSIVRGNMYRSRSKGECSFGFLREDGNELAIRIILNQNKDLIGYWRPAFPLERLFRGKDKFLDLLQPLMRHLESCCPL